MKTRLSFNKKTLAVALAASAVAITAALLKSDSRKASNGNGPGSKSTLPSDGTVELTQSQLNAIKIEPVVMHQR